MVESIYDKPSRQDVWFEHCPECKEDITRDMDWPKEVVVHIDESGKKTYFHRHCWIKWDRSHPISFLHRVRSANRYNP